MKDGTDAAGAATAGAPEPVLILTLYSDETADVLVSGESLHRAGMTPTGALSAVLFHVALFRVRQNWMPERGAASNPLSPPHKAEEA
jgi:hypothetical protein